MGSCFIPLGMLGYMHVLLSKIRKKRHELRTHPTLMVLKKEL